MSFNNQTWIIDMFQSEELVETDVFNETKAYIKICVKEKCRWLTSTSEGAQVTMEEREIPIEVQTFEIEFVYLLFPQLSRLRIRNMLSSMCTHLANQQVLENEIVDFALNAANTTTETKRKGVAIVLEIELAPTREYNERETFDRVVTESMDVDMVEGICASRPLIEALETKILSKDGCREFLSCMICLEEFSVGMEVTSMPCSHVFHGRCIGSWLEQRNSCPICRFELEVD